jgi:ribosomal protein S18 acetylase RimI-like enzyme
MTSELKLRGATSNDLLYIVRMLADDFLGGTREKPEDPLPESYLGAFHEIESDLNNELIVAEIGNQIVGAFQLTYTPSLSFQGGKRCTIESVRVDERLRGQGIGHQMMLWAIERAKEKGCVSMQLTTHSERKSAQRSYEKLGFKGTHLGMKLELK